MVEQATNVRLQHLQGTLKILVYSAHEWSDDTLLFMHRGSQHKDYISSGLCCCCCSCCCCCHN